MDPKLLINTNIAEEKPLPTPEEVRRAVPLSEKSSQVVLQARQVIRDILDEKDPRLFFVVGPCSIHDPKAALEYAERLKGLSEKVSEKFLLVMRVYFEKPRTTVGWKGFINDPFLDDSFHIEEGLKQARQLLLKITEMGLPTATEALDPIVPQYLSELICWSAIGARTIESQTHREMASGLSMPVGFKNGTDGNIQVAIDAMKSALTPHHFLGIDQKGRSSIFRTRGNPYSHVVLRGGRKPNYDPESLSQCESVLEAAGLRKKIMVDCSHGNSRKDHRNQPQVFQSCLDQIREERRSLVGMMIESHLFEGNQKIPTDMKNRSQLRYGVSVTDKCLDWKTTEELILRAFKV